MSRNRTRLFWLRVFNVRKEESATVSNFLLHHFFLGLGLALLLTVAGTFFLSHFDPENFPIAYIFSAVGMMITGKIYAHFEHTVPFRKLLPGVLITLVILTVLFRLSFILEGSALLPIALMIGFRIIYLLSNLEFWGLSAMVFDVRQSKRLFGLISSGDVPAKLLGYLSVYMLVPHMGLQNLLIVAAVSFAISYYFLNRIFFHSGIRLQHKPGHHHQPAKTNGSAVLRSYFGNDFIFWLAILGFLTTAAFTLIDYSFLSNVQSKYHSQEDLASFLSIFFSLGYSITLLIKLIFSGRLADKMGVKRSLLLMPGILLGFCIWYLVKGSANTDLFMNLAFIGILSMAAGVIKYSVNDPVYLAMFQPLQTQMRLKGHTVIKGFIQPVALGVIGIVLWFTYHRFGEMSFYRVNNALLIILILWIPVVFYTSKKYVEALGVAISKRFITGSEVVITDVSYFTLLRKKIRTGNSGEIIYSLQALDKSNPSLLQEEIPALLKREDDLVLEHTVKAIRKHNWSQYSEELFRVFNNGSSERVRALAVRTFCHFNTHDADRVLAAIDHSSRDIRIAIIAGLITSDDLPGRMAAEQKLLELISSRAATDRIAACEIISSLGNKNFFKPLLTFFDDPNIDVRRAAIAAAQQVINDKLIEPLFGLLESGQMRREVVLCLSESGSPAVKYIQNHLDSGKTSAPELIHDFIKILERSKGPLPAEILFRLLKEEKVRIREAVLNALVTLHFIPDQSHQPLLTARLNEEFTMALQMLVALNNRHTPENLKVPVQFELLRCRRRIFDLLSILYDREIVRKAEAALNLTRSEKTANAIEILDQIIPRKTYDLLAALIDNISLNEKITRLKSFSKESDDSFCITVIKEGKNKFSDWTISSAMLSSDYAAGITACLVKYYQSESLLLQQSATFALRKIMNTHPGEVTNQLQLAGINPQQLMSHKHPDRLTEIEKVIVMKGTALFSETPENVIAEIVSIVREVVAGKDEVIFRKGDSGSSMYIIYEGEVKIHDGEKTFATLKSQDFFGELALLDPEPRSATATATTETLLLKLDEEEAYELMEERTEVLKSIMRILCRRIRNQNEKLIMAGQVN